MVSVCSHSEHSERRYLRLLDLEVNGVGLQSQREAVNGVGVQSQREAISAVVDERAGGVGLGGGPTISGRRRHDEASDGTDSAVIL